MSYTEEIKSTAKIELGFETVEFEAWNICEIDPASHDDPGSCDVKSTGDIIVKCNSMKTQWLEDNITEGLALAAFHDGTGQNGFGVLIFEGDDV